MLICPIISGVSFDHLPVLFTIKMLCFSFVINKYIMRKYLRLCEYPVPHQNFINYFCIPLRSFD